MEEAEPLGTNLPRLDVYPITDDRFGWMHVQIAKAVINAGVEILQFREKKKGLRECITVATALRKLTRKKGVTFIVNDRVDLAQAVDADGVHLGQNDMPLHIARKILGEDKIIGISAETIEQAKKGAMKADYLGVGPIFPTSTKKGVGPALGLDSLKKISEAVNIPVVGIGGITLNNVREVIENGAEGIAVISAIAEKKNPYKVTVELLEKVRKAKRSRRRS
ncbi:MAG: thiamine phosphate synthase [Candidatus Korarchaeota archaeon]|nr:thiamine phosphate synthase [Candidatus Korarchaeota archaeon]NIU82900.1 thiamine phosphate synthase [Candidatus Thorarchaeota archaeon]NIW14749.1 thiamine phosphate synthase [Candidatus Thorarchaeota archaeon]NIW52820.1 thiamine phosphate synthase [Candidatus Korarchaeota archaeon]